MMLYFIKWLFGIKQNIISYGELPSVKEHLKPSQIIKAMNYYKNNVHHIKKIMKETNIACDVSFEDKSKPNLWKPGHWLWFFDKHKK